MKKALVQHFKLSLWVDNDEWEKGKDETQLFKNENNAEWGLGQWKKAAGVLREKTRNNDEWGDEEA